MKAWEVVRPGSLATGPIELVDKARPEPGPQEIRVRVSTCGVCRTDLVPAALAALDRGGTLAIAGIHLSEIPPLDYQEHLFFEREIASVTANTRRDGEDFLDIAARIGIEVSTVPFPLSKANKALSALRSGGIAGTAVLHARD